MKIKVRKTPGKQTAVHRDKTKYSRKAKYKGKDSGTDSGRDAKK